MAAAGARRRTRRELARHPSFDRVSPEAGVVDEDALSELAAEDGDATLALLADLVGSADARLAALARRLAAELIGDLAASATPRRSGIGRLRRLPLSRSEGDVDVDSSVEGLVGVRAGAPVDPHDIVVAAWARCRTHLALLVDRSGSMGGHRLATASVAAAAVAHRAGGDRGAAVSVLAFARDTIVVAAAQRPRPPVAVALDLLRLRGHGTTDLDTALRSAADQLSRVPSDRRLAVLLSDCRFTSGVDPLTSAHHLPELAVIAPADDSDDARLFARRAGARFTTVDGPLDIPRALDRVVG